MASWNSWKNRLCVALLLGAASSQAFADPVLSINATPNPAVTGKTIALDLQISDVTDLYGYQYTLWFNPAILQATGASEGAFLGTGGTTFGDLGVVDNTAGSISWVYNSLIGQIPGVSGSGSLGHFNFNVIGKGSSMLSVDGTLFLDSHLNDVAVHTNTLLLQAVPEPQTYLMFGIGLAGLALLRRRKIG